MLASTICAPTALRSAGESVRTVACVPTGMNTGVSTVPWGSVREPERAAPDWPSIQKSNMVNAKCELGNVKWPASGQFRNSTFAFRFQTMSIASP